MIQLVVFSLFIVCAGIFHFRLNRNPTPVSLQPDVPWLRYMVCLYIVSGLILVRSLFRAIEYFQGYDGELQQAEYYLFIFDSVLMVIAMVTLNVYHPSQIVAGRGKGETKEAAGGYNGMGSVEGGFEMEGEAPARAGYRSQV